MDNRIKIQEKIKSVKNDMKECEYRHFKGNTYIVTDIAVHSETEKPMVIYRSASDPNMVWCRPLDMFLSEVDHEKYPDVKQKMRFEKIVENEQEEENKKRDVPKKLKRYRRFMGTMFDSTFCPVCEQTIPDNGKVINYCSFCGQRLLQKEWEFSD